MFRIKMLYKSQKRSHAVLFGLNPPLHSRKQTLLPKENQTLPNRLFSIITITFKTQAQSYTFEPGETGIEDVVP